MTIISHKEAHLLLQKAADQMLIPEEKFALEMHLESCKDCQEYANILSVLETHLRTSLHKKWDPYQPENLTPQAIINPSLTKLFWSNFANRTGMMGKATIIATLLLGYFVISNLFGLWVPISENETASIVPTPNNLMTTYVTSPTPSVPFTLTGSIPQGCETFGYIVQKNDTLASIALQHGTTQELISEYNQLTSKTVFTGTELLIPICDSMPSHTATLPENTMTITPVNSGTIFPTQRQ